MVIENSVLVSKQKRFVFESVYPLIRTRLNTLDYSISLTNAFDELSESPYLDFCHVNHIGNKIIAYKIWNTIIQKINSN